MRERDITWSRKIPAAGEGPLGVVRAASPMALTFDSAYSIMAPLSPEIRTITLSNLIKLTPNFWGEGLGGVGGEGKTSREKHSFDFAPH